MDQGNQDRYNQYMTNNHFGSQDEAKDKEGIDQIKLNNFNFLPSVYVQLATNHATYELIKDDDIDIFKDGIRPKIPKNEQFF